MFMPKDRRCKDCIVEGVTTNRPAPHPGPRCASHWRKRQKAVSKRNHENRVRKTYGLNDGDYDRLYAAQGGRCAICRKATGKVKRLAVDHDHETGEVRGLLCFPCNHDVLGKLGDDPEVYLRIIRYLLFPPARHVLSVSEDL